ncbi:hypothetical protein KAH55_05855, partial [bacterium]|nr:hypothetical protein [bacterium]
MNKINNTNMSQKPMSLGHMIAREIAQRKLNFLSACLAVTAAVAVFTGAMTMLRVYDQRTEHIIIQKEKNTRARMAQLEDDYRVITKGLGFNLLILPKEQELSHLYAEDYATHFMPESYVHELAESKIVTIRHLLPSLQQKIWWPEARRTIILFGTRGEVPFLHRAQKEPMLFPVPAGQAVLGYELHQNLEVSPGDSIQILGKPFVISNCNSRRGNKDDITIWIDLKQAQELLKHVGEINGILALKCLCVGTDLAKVRSDINEILPGVQIIEQSTRVIARAEARHRAAAEAEQAIAAERNNRVALRAVRE